MASRDTNDFSHDLRARDIYSNTRHDTPSRRATHDRVTFRRVCDAMQVAWHPRASEVESTLARKVYERVSKDRERELRTDRWRGFKIGAAMVGGGTLLAVTGGLAAPALAAGLAASSSVIGASAAATLSGFATTAWMATVFGAGGAGLLGYKMDRRTQGVKVGGRSTYAGVLDQTTAVCPGGASQHRKTDRSVFVFLNSHQGFACALPGFEGWRCCLGEI